jgi:hypothetical protein
MKHIIKKHANHFAMLLMALATAFTFLACEEKQPDVYVAGEANIYPTLWINGEPQELTEERVMQEAKAVYVTSSDVYVAGWISSVATLWKNGTAQSLSDGKNEARANSVYVNGNDVYVAGHDGDNAVLWKNGVVQSLANEARANSVYVNGKDVYVAGYNKGNAILWKNGDQQNLTGGNEYAQAYSVYVHGKDVYVAGYHGQIATLWKNGTQQNLTDGKNGAVAFSVYVANKDVYVAGYNGSDAVLWKNGVAQNFASARAYSVYVFGKDVYVAGETNRKATLWKNGIAQEFDEGEARSVFAVAGNSKPKQVMEVARLEAKRVAEAAEKAKAEKEMAELNAAEKKLPIVLTPTNSGDDEFVRRAANSDEWDGAYGFVTDPNGAHYHFSSYASEGDTKWDGMSYDQKFTASSTLAPQGNNRYDAVNLKSGTRSDTWCEGVKGYGIGERINMSITTQGHYSNDGIGFTSLMVVNGFAKNQVTFNNNARVKILRLYVGNKHWYDLHLKDVIKPQVFQLRPLAIEPHKLGKKVTEGNKKNVPVGATYQTDLSFEIREVYSGDKYEDTCITGIALDGYSNVY